MLKQLQQPDLRGRFKGVLVSDRSSVPAIHNDSNRYSTDRLVCTGFPVAFCAHIQTYLDCPSARFRCLSDWYYHCCA
jgi:hypothetical protein